MFAMPQLRLIFLSLFISSVLLPMEDTSIKSKDGSKESLYPLADKAHKQNLPVAGQSGASCGYHSILNSVLSLPGMNKNALNEIRVKFSQKDSDWRDFIIKMRKEKLVKKHINNLLHTYMPRNSNEQKRNLNDNERRALGYIANAYAKAFVSDEKLNILKENPKNLESRLQEIVKRDQPNIEDKEVQSISRCIHMINLTKLSITIDPAHKLIAQACTNAKGSNLATDLFGDNLNTEEMEALKDFALEKYGITDDCITIIDETNALKNEAYKDKLNPAKKQMLCKDCIHSFCIRTSDKSAYNQQEIDRLISIINNEKATPEEKDAATKEQTKINRELSADARITHWISVTLDRKNGQNTYLIKNSTAADYTNHSNVSQLIEELEQTEHNAQANPINVNAHSNPTGESKNKENIREQEAYWEDVSSDEDKAHLQQNPIKNPHINSKNEPKIPEKKDSNESLSIKEQEAFCNRYGKSLAVINLAYELAPLDAKDIVDKLTRPHRYPKDFYRASFFLGGPGVGKTTLAIAMGLITRKLAAGWYFKYFTHSDFDGEGRNATSIKLKEKLQEVVDSKEKTIIFVDELHRLFENSGDKHYDTANTSSTLWTFLDQQTFNENFFFIGCMNEATNMADPMKDRMCTNSITLPKPTIEMKRNMFLLKFTDTIMKLHKDCNNQFIDALLLQLEGWSGRNINGLVDKAFDLARRNDRDSDILTINTQHLEAARQYIDIKRNIEFKCGQKEESESERLQKEALAHAEKLQQKGFEHSEDLQDKNVAQTVWLQLKAKSLDRSIQVNGSINGGIDFSPTGGANVGFNFGGSGTHSIVLDSDYEEIKKGLTNNQVRHLNAILAEVQARFVRQVQDHAAKELRYVLVGGIADQIDAREEITNGTGVTQKILSGVMFATGY